MTYHRDYAGRWFLTLAQGTEESRSRLLAALPQVLLLPRRAVHRPPGRERPSQQPASGVAPVRSVAPRSACVLRAGVLGQRRGARRGRRRSVPSPAAAAGRPAHRGALPPARRDAVRRPRPPDGGVVMAGDHARSRHATSRGTVTDPEMPMLTLADLGVLRAVALEGDRVVVTITPTYSGCPAMATMRDDLVHRLRDAGFEAEVRVSLSPAVVERLDHPRAAGARWPSTGSRRRARPRADPSRSRCSRPVGRSPARGAAVGDDGAGLGVRADGVHGALPVRLLPRARSSTSRRSDGSHDPCRCASTRSPSPRSSDSATTRSRSPSTCRTTCGRRTTSRRGSR